MKDTRQFFVFWLVNSFIFYFAAFVLVGLVVIGNARLTAFMASVISGFLLALADVAIMPVCNSLSIKLKDEWQWVLVYLFINVLGVWVIARYADLTGVGITNAWMAVFLGIVLNLGQWGAWKLISKQTKK